MKIDIELVRKTTQAALSGDLDVSHLTEELVEESRANATPLEERSGELEGNTFMRDGNVWKWREGCGNQWYTWSGNASATRIVNCLNGFIKYRIRWW